MRAVPCSPDGKRFVYQQTDYNLAENRGVTTLWVEEPRHEGHNALDRPHVEQPRTALERRRAEDLFPLGPQRFDAGWEMAPAGGDVRQPSDFGRDVEGFGISPRGDKGVVRTARTGGRPPFGRHPQGHGQVESPDLRRPDGPPLGLLDEGEYLHIFVGDFGPDGLKEGRDISAPTRHGMPAGPYFDTAEIAWNHAGTMLAYTCKPLTGTAYAVSTDSTSSSTTSPRSRRRTSANPPTSTPESLSNRCAQPPGL